MDDLRLTLLVELGALEMMEFRRWGGWKLLRSVPDEARRQPPRDRKCLPQI